MIYVWVVVSGTCRGWLDCFICAGFSVEICLRVVAGLLVSGFDSRLCGLL